MSLKAALDALTTARHELEAWDRAHPTATPGRSDRTPICYRLVLGQALAAIAEADSKVGFLALDTGELTGDQ